MQNCDHNIGFWEKRQFFRKNWQKSQKIVIITSIPGLSVVQPQNRSKLQILPIFLCSQLKAEYDKKARQYQLVKD
jgi:hypothetical protein